MREPARETLARVGLAGRENVIVANMSHGEHRQLEIAMALATRPRMLLLDEPMAGMGPEESVRMIALLRELKRELTILLIEHDMDAVFALADRISVLVYGRVIASGEPAAIRANAEVRRAYLGEQDGQRYAWLTRCSKSTASKPATGAARSCSGFRSLAAGEMVTLMGRNGMGKTTTVRSIMGLTPAMAGSIRFAGEDIRDWPSYRIGKLGIGLVPEGRQVFPNLTAQENLVATAANRSGASEPWTLDKICALFPRLAERLDSMGHQLSGGEQQMLAIGRALMTNPRLLVLDEATEGLAPLMRAEIWQCLSRLKAQGQSILVIDKNVETLTRIADRHYLIERGRVVWSGTSAALAAAPDIQHRYLGV